MVAVDISAAVEGSGGPNASANVLGAMVGMVAVIRLCCLLSCYGCGVVAVHSAKSRRFVVSIDSSVPHGTYDKISPFHAR